MRKRHECAECSAPTENLLDTVGRTGMVKAEYLCRECLVKRVLTLSGKVVKVDVDAWLWKPEGVTDYKAAVVLKYHDRGYDIKPETNWEMWAKHWLG